MPTHILLFDGECELCDRSVRSILQLDKKEQFQFASLQSEAGSRLRKETNTEDIDSVVLLRADGRVFIRSDAALETAALLGWPAKAAAIFKWLPRFVRDPVYNWIAEHRFQLFGKKSVCGIPSKADRARFLD
ncbi:thiol-disulfide oxidoreductase DCC family protein [Alkalicoccus urumqiensis]|uniref:Thiol-disulfide oxidoreductase n=1 Tax=Alkalicoccus urumqiensis TaxID=1548213 RepID=A0A2P6MKZ1_ALKUR|nr:DCC1-like thiol-disulfide oxidoreductase family protein [Alkalicoccus urumqiensis]PRO66935.1 thiol-disulfide oxidoreductase [Alkalicoccus urumqiensis]